MPCMGPWYSEKHRICHSPLRWKRQKAFEHSSVCAVRLTEPVGTTPPGIAGRGEDLSREDAWKVFAPYAHLSMCPRTSQNPGSKPLARLLHIPADGHW